MDEKEKYASGSGSSSTFHAPFQGWPAVTASSYSSANQTANIEALRLGSRLHNNSIFSSGVTGNGLGIPLSSSHSSPLLGFQDHTVGSAPSLCFDYGQRSGGNVLPLRADLLSGLNSEQKSAFQMQVQQQQPPPLMFGGKVMTSQEMVEAKALAASKSHSEAERRRRERINNHLATLRSLLPSTTKTDKASLLAEVIEHVKELKRLVGDMEQVSPVPSESDEVSVDHLDDAEGHLLIRASLCCEDRPDLLTDLTKALRTLRLRAVKAEMATLGGRVKNVFVVTSGGGNGDSPQDTFDEMEEAGNSCPSVSSIHDALKAVLEKHNLAGDLTNNSGSSKRQRQVGQFSSS